MDDERFLTVAEVAERLKMNPETVRVWIRERKLRAVLPGGRKIGYRIPESELRRLLSGELEGKAAA